MDFFISLPLISLLLNLFLVFMVLHRDQKSRLNQIFSHFLLGLGLWSLIIFGVRSSTDGNAVALWMKAIVALLPLTMALYFHFTLIYTGTAIRRWRLIAIYAVCAVFIGLATTDLVISGVTASEYTWAPKWGPLAFLFVLTIGFFMLSGIITLVKFIRAARLRIDKAGAGLITDATILCILGSVIGLISSLGVSIFPIAIFCNMVFSAVSGAVVLKFHMLDRKAMLRRLIIYAFLLILTGIIYSIIIFLVGILFSPANMYMALNFVAFLAVAMGLTPAYRSIEEQVDRWFYHERYDKLKALEKFSLQTYKIDNLDELSATLVGLISEALQTADVFLLQVSGNGDLITVSSTRKDEHQYTIKRDSPLASWLRSNRLPLSREKIMTMPSLKEISKHDLGNMESIKAELLVPVVTKQNELAGLIVLGQKMSSDSYSREDESMALLVASNTATQLENARLYRLEKTIREEIQQQAEQKTTFLHTIAHELKTPLTAIISSSELLVEEQPVPDHMRERIINNIRKSAESMDKRVTELLDLARIEIGVLQILPEPLLMNDLITEVVSQLTPVFDSKQQLLKAQLPRSLPKVNADRERIKQVVYNLLANAHKFAPPESEIMIRAYNGSDRIIVEVEDGGPVIPENDRGRLFDPYFRGEDPEKSQKFPGLGLGLSLSKKIIELQEGEIWYDPDKAPNHNTFAFSLPVLTGRDIRRQIE